MPSYVRRPVSDIRQQALAESAAAAHGTVIVPPQRLIHLRALVPFDQYAFSGLDLPGLGVGAGVMLASDMPPDFLKAYLASGLTPHDPMYGRITPDSIWASWHDLTASELSEDKLQAIQHLERSHLISTRSVVGFYRDSVRYGGATFTRKTPFTPEEKLILECVGRVVHCELSDAHLARMVENFRISDGEIKCLRAVSEGLPPEIASQETGYTPDTINAYVKSITKKLGARNRTHAVMQAIRLRLFR